MSTDLIQRGDLWLHHETSQQVANELNRLFHSKARVRLWYGDTKTGRAWMEENDVLGTISRSTGREKVPLLIYSARSMGGPHILENCIVRIDLTDGRTLYKHPNFYTGLEQAKPVFVEGAEWPWVVFDADQNTQASFKTEAGAKRWINFMLGASYRK